MKKAVDHLKKSDPVLRAIIERVGPCKIKFIEPVFETLVRSIVYQQLHGKAALTIFTRLKEAAKTEPLTPESVLKLTPARMRKLGLSKQKLTYIRGLAKMTRAGDIDFAQCLTLEDQEVIEHLTSAKGVGEWTAHMFLIFALRRTDVLPVGDLGVRMAMKKAYQLEELPKPDEMRRLAAAWSPYASIASWYMWRSLEGVGAM